MLATEVEMAWKERVCHVWAVRPRCFMYTMHKRIPLQYNFVFPFTVGGHSYLPGVGGAMARPLSVGSQPGDWRGSVCRVHQVRSRLS